MARISPGTMTAAIFAILVGLAGAYGVRQYLHQPPAAEVAEEEPAGPEMIYVPVAGQDLVHGRPVSLNDIVVLRMTREKLRDSRYVGTQFMRDTRQIAGRVLRTPLAKGDAFQMTDFYPEGMGPGIDEMLKPGYRAVTVPIENIGAVEGYARPGSLVDVLFRSQSTESLPELTVTLLERVEVLAVGRITIPGAQVNVAAESEMGTVTLAVTPSQAKALKVVEGRGSLSMSLRNPDDNVIVPVGLTSEQVTLRQLLALPPAPRRTKMDVFRSGDKTTYYFDDEPDTFVEQRPRGLIKTPIAADIRNDLQPLGSRPIGLEVDSASGGGG